MKKKKSGNFPKTMLRQLKVPFRAVHKFFSYTNLPHFGILNAVSFYIVTQHSNTRHRYLGKKV